MDIQKPAYARGKTVLLVLFLVSMVLCLVFFSLAFLTWPNTAATIGATVFALFSLITLIGSFSTMVLTDWQEILVKLKAGLPVYIVLITAVYVFGISYLSRSNPSIAAILSTLTMALIFLGAIFYNLVMGRTEKVMVQIEPDAVGARVSVSGKGCVGTNRASEFAAGLVVQQNRVEPMAYEAKSANQSE